MNADADIRAAMLSALAWQAELGADEAISETPIDRLAASAQGAAPAARPVAVVAAAPRERGAEGGAVTGTLFESGADPASPAQPVESPAALAAGAQSLEGLASAMRGWGGSPLRETARNFVFSDGLVGARLMVIGEAPGADEDRIGRPFVGRAGRLLDRMMAAIGISRTDSSPESACYIANILPWRPPGNRTPSEAEAQMFLPFMTRHIQLAGPDIVFAIGNTAVKALLGTTTGIKRLRGTWTHHPVLGLPVLPSFHPAYLLRQPADKRLAWRDLLSLRAALDGEITP